jgi:hypothetical protein
MTLNTLSGNKTIGRKKNLLKMIFIKQTEANEQQKTKSFGHNMKLIRNSYNMWVGKKLTLIFEDKCFI